MFTATGSTGLFIPYAGRIKSTPITDYILLILYTGGFSNVYATFVFDRRTSYTVLQVFLPSYLIVILSFMALWLPQDAVPARVALGITTVLTIVYFLGRSHRSISSTCHLSLALLPGNSRSQEIHQQTLKVLLLPLEEIPL